MPIHAIVNKRFDVDSNSGLTSGTPMLRCLPTRVAVVLSTTFLVAAVPNVFAQRPQHHEHKHIERGQIVALEHQWQQAALADDIPVMDKLLSEDYLGITANGEVLTKAQQLDHMRNHQLFVTRLQSSDFKIKLIGQIAIVTSLAHVEGSSDGEPLHGDYRYTRVYQRLPGGMWKITSFEITPANGLQAMPSSQK
jgi:ketosteroid isomerase-like protein